MHEMLEPEVRVIVTKAMAIRAMVVVMAMVMGRPMVRSIPWIHMSSRGICLVYPKGINLRHLVTMSIGLIRLGQKTEFKNYSL